MSSSIPVDSPWRGCAAPFPQPVSETNLTTAQYLWETVYYLNCRAPQDDPLPDIVYRSSEGESDIVNHVFRWDTRPYQDVFEHGFQVRRQQDIPDETYYNLERYVNRGGSPLNSDNPTWTVFVSTTSNSGWRPSIGEGESLELYRYEIYAPGGIFVNETLGERYNHSGQQEIAFPGGIAPQYIRSAQLFRLFRERSSMFTSMQRVNTRIVINGRVNPQSHPERLIRIRNPVFYYLDENRRRQLLILVVYRPQLPEIEIEIVERAKREVSTDDIIGWYSNSVGDVETYINAGFRSNIKKEEAYLFMKNEYLLLYYAPGTDNETAPDRVINGPLMICDGFPSLTGTSFADFGVDCAFGYHNKNEAFIFSGNLCAHIEYASGTANDKILKGPMPIIIRFPFFKDTVFEKGIDAAFEATAQNEAYLFKDDQYALINYSQPKLIAIQKITDGFGGLRATIFADGIDAAFASSWEDQAYLFKGDQYAIINFATGSNDDCLIVGVNPILPHWPSLQTILPRKNRGLDVPEHIDTATEQDKPIEQDKPTEQDKPPVHDEL